MFRNWLAHKLLPTILKWMKPQPRIEGMLAMTILADIAELKAAVAVLQSAPAPTVDASGFATADALNAVVADVQTIKDEIGTEPATDPAS